MFDHKRELVVGKTSSDGGFTFFVGIIRHQKPPFFYGYKEVLWNYKFDE